MKKQRNIAAYLTLALALMGFQVQAQSPSGFQAKPVTISNLVDTVSGKVYLVHQVGEGHTLYSIGRAYKTSFDKMLKDSPDSQVDIDEYIYIPYQEGLLPQGTRLEKFTGKKPWVVVSLENTEHPDVVSFPPTTTINDTATPVAEEPATEPVAEPIAEATAEPLPEQEPETEPQPTPEPEPEPQSEPVTEPAGEEILDTIPAPIAQLVEKPAKDTLNIALMLPLYSNTPDDRRAYVYLPFFEGASLALLETQQPDFFAEADSITEETAPSAPVQPFRMKLYDLSQTDHSLQQALENPELARTDAIMAAAFATQFPELNRFSLEHQIPLIHPLSERDSLGTDNPWFVQLCASRNTQMATVAAFAGTYFKTHKILILADSTESEQKKAEYLHLMLSEAEYKIFSPDLEKELEGFAEEEVSEKTLIIPFFAKEITAAKTTLALRQSKNVTLLTPSVWLDYPTLELDYLLQNNLYVYTSFGKMNQTKDFKDFAKHYYFIYKGMPNKMAYQGYLSMLWLMHRMEAGNTNFLMRLADEMHAISDINAENVYRPVPRTGMPGFENPLVRFLQLTSSGLDPVAFN